MSTKNQHIRLKIKPLILIATFFYSGIVSSQNLYNRDKEFVDSLLINKENTVYIILEYCIRCAKGIGERASPNKSKSCEYNEEYCILWVNNDSMSSKISNNCYEMFLVKNNAILKDNLNELFVRNFTDTTLDNQSLNLTHEAPLDLNIPTQGSINYVIRKLTSKNKRSINFSEKYLAYRFDNANIKTDEHLLSQILKEFALKKSRLNIEGIKQNEEWH